ncbi:MAG TPA: hypothetical protein PK299_12960 [Anaerolineales bacterium]|nr:hypothetical protein [Anaerolineales bacterium]
MSTLLLEFWTEKHDFCIYAEAQDYEKEITLDGQAKEILSHFKTIYTILEEKHEKKVQELETAIQILSDLLLAPFTTQLKQCSLVRFVISEELIRCAFDLLLLEDSYLFLQRRVCYQIEEGYGEDEPAIELESALLIADLTADPEEACRSVSKLIPDAQYAQVESANIRMIREAAPEVDALIISAHGEIDADNDGGLYINEELLSAKVMEKVEAWVVYFDSCQQGANLAYVQALQEESDAQYYLAPIISNDAGDSSTKTMVWFFNGVKEHKDPIRGLYETRKRLFEYYHGQKRLNLVVSLNKAFAFRLFEFVDSDESEEE